MVKKRQNLVNAGSLWTTPYYVSKNGLDFKSYSVSSMGILVMSIPFDCSLLVSLFFHLEPICEPKYGQLKTDPARSPLPVTQPQLHIQVSLCQSMNLIWTHEFDKSDKIKRSLYLVHYIYFFPTDFAFCFDLGTYSKWIFVLRLTWSRQKKWSYNSLLTKQAANF